MSGREDKPARSEALADDGDDQQPRILGRRPGPAFTTRVTTLPPGGSLAYDETAWRDALVIVRSGEVELECAAGGRRTFAAGDLLWLTGLELRVLHNHGDQPAVLVAVARRGRRRSQA
ncbi:cupin domain-containing protein [Actinopolymorpha alba]|uniref:cupin domain-containing protein n=1 Tax=Actinopolymorpha alba TaxID=533267 RepID=UPI00037E815D|nr:cupin domain-containing protein [Actinopolymorpha alba]